MKFLTNINLFQNELQNAALQNLASAPLTPVTGQAYFDTTVGTAFIYNGTKWVPTDVTKALSPITFNGQLLSNIEDPVSAQDAATKHYVDAGDAASVVSANAYTNSVAASGSSGSNTYTNTQVASALLVAENYSNAANTVLSTTLTSAYIAADAVVEAFAIQRVNHTGTQTSSTISDLAPTVQGYTLDLFAPPASAVSFNGKNLVNLADPLAPTDAANKEYVDSVVQSAAAGIDSKPAVAVVSIADVPQTGLQTIDGVTLVDGDRVLLVGETDTTKNGPWIASAGAWARPTGPDSLNGELALGAFWYVERGTLYAASQWRLSMPNEGTITAGSTPIIINQFGAAVVYTAIDGIELTGNQYSGVVDPTGGLTVGPSGFAVDTTVVARKYSTTIGDGASTSITITHNLNTEDVTLSLRDVLVNIGSRVETDWLTADANSITLNFTVAPATGAYRVTVVG